MPLFVYNTLIFLIYENATEIELNFLKSILQRNSSVVHVSTLSVVGILTRAKSAEFFKDMECENVRFHSK